MQEPKALITNYLHTLSGNPKPPDTVSRFVADEHLAKHIADSEAAFPNYEIVVEDIIAEGNKVAVRGKFRGVHRGPFAGIEGTGRTVTAGLMIIYAVDGDRIVDHWMQFDVAGLMQQLQPAAEVTTA